MLGYAWDIWPGDTGAARIATGHAMSLNKALETVEGLLAGDDNAYFGVMVKPDLTALICRRSRVPGQFYWSPLCSYYPADTASAADTAHQS